MATFEKLDGSSGKLTIEVRWEEFDKAINSAYGKAKDQYNVPGFRKGKAPRKMIENMYGPLAFFDDAFDIIYPEAYDAAIKEHDVTPVSRPDISILECEPGETLVFEAQFAIKPEVKLGDYKGIEVAKQEYNVTDDMVEAQIDQEREKIARYVDMERPVENGDQVILDYLGSIDGVNFDGGAAEDATLVIGSGTFIPGFEEQMIGMQLNEEKDITLTFPEEYHNNELAGKEAVFHVKVKEIQVKELPEADDEFAKDVSEFDTIAELREDKRKQLTERAERDAKVQRENEAVGKAVDNATVEIPDAMTERQLDHMMNDIRYRLSMQGLSLEDYCKFTGTDMNVMRGEMKDDAAKRVKSQLVLEAIASAEDIVASEEEIEEKLNEYVAQYGEHAEEFKANLTEDDRLYFADQIMVDKTVDLILNNAVEK